MTCERTAALRDALTLGEGPAPDPSHLAACAACRAEVERAGAIAAAFRGARPPAGFADRVLAGVVAGGAAAPRAPSGSNGSRPLASGGAPVATRTGTSSSGSDRVLRARRDSPRRVLARRAAAAAVLAVASAAAVYAALGGFGPAPSPGRTPRPVAVEPPPPAKPQAALSLEIDAPASLREGDEVEVAIVLRREGGHGSEADVALEVAAAGTLEVVVEAPSRARLAPGEERRAGVTVRAAGLGSGTISVAARGPSGETRAGRTVRVRPSGREADVGVTLLLRGPETRLRAILPADAFRLSPPRAVTLRVIPGLVAEAELGLRELVHMPHGCFEQTTAATYPSLMVLTLAREGRAVDPALLSRAREAAAAGALRLRTFQMPDGGFSIHGRTASVPWLTAYGLQELTHLARAGVEVDPLRIEGAASRLLAFEDGRGGLASLEERGTWNAGEAGDVAALAFVAHALASAGYGADPRAVRIAGRVERESMSAGRTVYELCLAAKALLALGREGPAGAIAARIAEAALPGTDPALVTWPGAPTLTRAERSAARVEATALAVQVLHAAGHNDLAARGLDGLLSLRRADGYGSTQAAVQALEAVRTAGGPLERATGRIAASVAGVEAATIELPGGPGARLVEVPLAPASLGEEAFRLALERGVEISFRGAGTATAQVVASGYASPEEPLPGEGPAGPDPGLVVVVDRPDRAPPGPQRWTVRVRNGSPALVFSPMVVADLPAGYALRGDGGLGALAGTGLILAHEMHAGRLALYLPDLQPDAEIRVPVDMEARLSGRVSSGTTEAYAYYDRRETIAFAEARMLVVDRRAPAPAARPDRPAAGIARSTNDPAGPKAAPRAAAPSPGPAADAAGNGPSESAEEREASSSTLRIECSDPSGPLAISLDSFPLGTAPLDLLLTRALARGLPEFSEHRTSRDGLSWVFRIARDARWSDGTRISAEDVLLSWRRARDEVRAPLPPLVDALQLELLQKMTAERLADDAIEVKLVAPCADLRERLRCFPFLVAMPFTRSVTRPEDLATSGAYVVARADPELIVLRSARAGATIEVRRRDDRANISLAPENPPPSDDVVVLVDFAGAARDRKAVETALRLDEPRIVEAARLRAVPFDRPEVDPRAVPPGGLPPVEVAALCEVARPAADAIVAALSARGASVALVDPRIAVRGEATPPGSVCVRVTAVVSSGAPKSQAEGWLPLGTSGLPFVERGGHIASLVDMCGYLRENALDLLRGRDGDPAPAEDETTKKGRSGRKGNQK
jgi:hypothetical protein